MNPKAIVPHQHDAPAADAPATADASRLLDTIDALVARERALAAEGSTAPIDLSSLLKRCLDDAVFCGMLLHKFAARSVDQSAALIRALDSRNAIELAERAHALKGVAVNLSAQSLAECAAALEHVARQGDLKAAREWFDRTQVEIDRCVQAVPDLLCRIAAAKS